MQNNEAELTISNIPWLTDDIIVGADSSTNMSATENELMFTKNSESTGGFVEISLNGRTQQLQRVISRCQCDFQYVNLGDELDPVAKEHIIGTPLVGF